MAHPMSQVVKLGKLDAVHDPRTAKLGPILERHLPTPPDAVDYGSKIVYPMWLNNKLGCCTQVAAASAVLVATTAAQAPVLFSNDNVLNNYMRSGYDPSKTLPDGSNVTDNGDSEVLVLNRWCTEGLERPGQTRDYLTAFGYVNPQNTLNVKRAIAMLGGLYIGLQLPKSAMADGDWIIVPGSLSAGGHAVFVHGYDANWLYLNTWGGIRRMSYAFFMQFCDEAYGLLSRQNWFSVHGVSPNTETFDQVSEELCAAMAA